MKVGSLFTGYGGLDIAVGGDLAWYSEIDKPACKVLQTHYPNVPNLGDIKKVDWSHVEAVDVITGGYPCQPFSHAGLRKGKNDERHLWPYVRDAIDALRPRYAILENVAGHVSLGFGDVLADLATIGFNAEWGIIRASDVGAPHGRKRLFIIAYPNYERFSRIGVALQTELGSESKTITGHIRNATDTEGTGLQRRVFTAKDHERKLARGRTTSERNSNAADSEHNGLITGEGRRGVRASSAQGRGVESSGNKRQLKGSSGSQSVTDTGGKRHGGGQNPTMVGGVDGKNRGTRGQSEHNSATISWGKYAPAIERWEHVLGRPAPSPTIWHKDRQRLNPVFVEWMMGLDEGHVTGHGLSSAQELKMLGNGVVPLQARAAINQLLERITP